jgi:UDP-galactopyranose mutase
MKINIVGGGLAGCTLATLFPGSTIYEREAIGGLCKDNRYYQDYVHVLHTDNRYVWDFINKYTDVRPHSTLLKAYVNGQLKPHPPKVLTDKVIDEQITGYSKKMWGDDIPSEALKRIITAQDGKIFHNEYEGVPNFTKLFYNLTKNTKVVVKDVRDGFLTGPIILTGAIDEYFNYCFGKLPYRGMKSTHYESETDLDADFVTFSDEKIPFQRLVDYKRLGYDGHWIGVEAASNDMHYPVRDEESEQIYEMYRKLAQSKDIALCGRLATYHYMNMDEVVEQCFELASHYYEV